MSTVLQRLSPGARVAVIRLRSLGDCVLTTPAISLLKQFRPDLQIAVVVEDAFAPVFSGNPDIDRILPPKVSEVSRFRPHLAVNLHGGGSSAWLTLMSRAGLRAAFAHFRFAPIYNVRIPRAQAILNVDRTVHTTEHLASAMFFLGVPQREIPRAMLFATPKTRSCPYAVLHPLASAPEKTWASSNFLAVAEHIQRNLGLEPIFIAGPGESLVAFDRYTCISGASLEEVKSLLAGAGLFVGNDSGPAHMAAAFGLPVVALFGASEPAIWHPWQTASAVMTSNGGINSIQVSQVVEAIESLPVPHPTTYLPQPK
jgi:lipopolysaccharide heptosyltransferase III